MGNWCFPSLVFSGTAISPSCSARDTAQEACRPNSATTGCSESRFRRSSCGNRSCRRWRARFGPETAQVLHSPSTDRGCHFADVPCARLLPPQCAASYTRACEIFLGTLGTLGPIGTLRSLLDLPPPHYHLHLNALFCRASGVSGRSAAW